MSTTLSTIEIGHLRDIAGTMIPASAEFGMPGADDPAIQADLVKSLGRDLPLVREAIAAIVEKAGGAFAGLGGDKQETLIDAYCSNGDAAAACLARAILSAYYRDDRVLVALGHEARAPFPKGYALEQGDWSLLETVKERAPFWRKDT
jgi:hypothetical protein